MITPDSPSALLRSMIVCPDYEWTYPKVSHGLGAYVFDESGKRYLDASSGSAGVANLGHGNLEVVDVVARQMAKITVAPTHVFSSEVLEDYLAALVKFAPAGCAKAWLVGSGTEAVENALKVALQYHQLRGEPTRQLILSRWGSYHGNSIFTLDVGGMKLRRNAYSGWMHNFPHIPAAYAYREQGSLTEAEYAQYAAQYLETEILRAGPKNVAAFVAEPIVAAALGAVPAPAGYFRCIREVCDRYGVLFIADEVLCGFGRTGTAFGMDHEGVKADIVAVGKGISGGYYPLSAVLLQGHVAAAFTESKTAFLGGHTFSCNPVGAAVGAWVLEYIQSQGIVGHVQKMGQVLASKLSRLRRHAIVGDVRGRGLMMGLEFVQDKVTKTPLAGNLKASTWIARRAFEKGVVVYPGRGSVDGVLGDHIMLTPPLICTESDLELLAAVLDESISDFQETHRTSAHFLAIH